MLNGWGGTSEPLYLAQGLHSVSVFVVYGKSGKSINVQWSEPGIAKGDIPASALLHQP
jgi:hypothetical protein